MTDNEHLFRIKQLADTKQLPLLDEQEFLKFQLDSREELILDEDGITVYIPINFDADNLKSSPNFIFGKTHKGGGGFGG